MQQDEQGLVLIIVKGKKDRPKLAHLFCRLCSAEDTTAGRKEVPICGAQKEGPWNFSAPPEDLCVVCDDLNKVQCQRCIREGRA